LARRVVTG